MIYIVCECAWNWLVETVTARAILRQDLTVFLYFLSVCVFFNIIYAQIHCNFRACCNNL